MAVGRSWSWPALKNQLMRQRRKGSKCSLWRQRKRQFMDIQGVNYQELISRNVDYILVQSLSILTYYFQDHYYKYNNPNRQTYSHIYTMGQSNTQTPRQSSISNPYFTHISSTRTSSSSSLLCHRPIPHRNIRLQWQSKVIILRNISNEHIMVPRQWQVVQNFMCGQGEIVEILYQDYFGHLGELIEERAKAGKYFQESQLWYVVYALTEVAVSLRKIGQKVGDIRPQNIMMNSQGQIKLMTYLSFPNTIHPYTDRPSLHYFSPQQLLQKQRGQMLSTADPVKAQSFSIGLTILAMVSLQNMNHLYDMESCEFNQNVMLKYVENVRNLGYIAAGAHQKARYSGRLGQCIKRLLQVNPKYRMDYMGLYQDLKPHISKIEEFSPFEITFTPTAPENKKQTHNNKQAITLQSRKKRNRQRSYSPSSKKKVVNEVVPSFHAPIVESRLVKLQQSTPPHPSPQPFTGPNPRLLQDIDSKLRRSREQFPS